MPDEEIYHPTVMMGFIDGKLHQMWMTASGAVEYRLVPIIQGGKMDTKAKAVAGFISEDDVDGDEYA